MLLGCCCCCNWEEEAIILCCSSADRAGSRGFSPGLDYCDICVFGCDVEIFHSHACFLHVFLRVYVWFGMENWAVCLLDVCCSCRLNSFPVWFCSVSLVLAMLLLPVHVLTHVFYVSFSRFSPWPKGTCSCLLNKVQWIFETVITCNDLATDFGKKCFPEFLLFVANISNPLKATRKNMSISKREKLP